jgi:phosphatidylethanolamine-binding protein (PEBP) family uncharacterized protein
VAAIAAAEAGVPKLSPGSLEVTSPAFAVGYDAPMPAAYTCAGAGVSPPLEFKGVPANTVALLLIVKFIGDAGSRVVWAVANISPSAGGAAEGGTPEGGVVGVNGEGQNKWGGICAPQGRLTAFSSSCMRSARSCR